MSRSRPLAWTLLALLALAVACGSQEASTPAGDQGAAAPAKGAATPAYEMAPEFSLDALDGGSVRLADLRGKVVVLDFWATWCPPCEFQIPILNQVHEHQKGKPVEIIGISVDTEGPDTVRAYLKTNPAHYRILMGSEALAREYGAPGFPSLFVIGPEGRIRQRHVGLIEVDELEGLIAGAS